MSSNVNHDQNKHRFFIGDKENPSGELKYLVKDNLMSINHTYVNPEYRGHGYAKDLVDAGVHYAQSHHLKVKPVCSYAYTVMESYYPDLMIRR